jgi:hypothetical protein
MNIEGSLFQGVNWTESPGHWPCALCNQDASGRVLQINRRGKRSHLCVSCVGLVGAVAQAKASDPYLRTESKLLGSIIGGYCIECGRVMVMDECGDEEPEVRVCNECAGIPPDEE